MAIDGDGIYSISGYGIATAPFTLGKYSFEVKSCRLSPQGFFKR